MVLVLFILVLYIKLNIRKFRNATLPLTVIKSKLKTIKVTFLWGIFLYIKFKLKENYKFCLNC